MRLLANPTLRLFIGAALITPAAVRLAHLALDRMPLAGVWRLAVRDLRTADVGLACRLSAKRRAAICANSSAAKEAIWSSM